MLVEYPIEFHKNRISVNSKKICGTNNYTVNPFGTSANPRASLKLNIGSLA